MFAQNQHQYTGAVIADPLQDVATLISPEGSPVWVTYRNPVIGEEVEIREWTGRLVRTTITSSEYVWRTARIEYTPEHGESGSPVFGSDGKVVCILSGKITRPPYGGLCQILR